jgi:chromosome segregation ATPase
MSNVINSAYQKVSDLGNHPVVGQFKARFVTHWSIPVLQAAAASGLIAAIAALATQNYLKGALYAFFAGANAIGFYYLQQFVPQSSIEKDTQKLEILVHKLKTQNQELLELTAKTEKTAKNARKAATEIEKNNQKNRQLVQQLDIQLKERTGQLDIAVDALSDFKELFSEVDKTRESAMKELSKLTTHNQKIQGEMRQLEDLMRGLDTTFTNLPKAAIARLNQNRQQQKALQKQQRAAALKVHKKLVGLTKIVTKFSTLLAQHTKQLKGVTEEIDFTGDRIEAQVEKLDQITDKVKKELMYLNKELDRNFLLTIIERLTNQNRILKTKLRDFTHE